eukprot:491548-Pelagomonas_calceolata.AAC.4
MVRYPECSPHHVPSITCLVNAATGLHGEGSRQFRTFRLPPQSDQAASCQPPGLLPASIHAQEGIREGDTRSLFILLFSCIFLPLRLLPTLPQVSIGLVGHGSRLIKGNLQLKDISGSTEPVAAGSTELVEAKSAEPLAAQLCMCGST